MMEFIQSNLPIILAIISSPILLAVFDVLKNKTSAFLQYREWQAVFLANGQVYFGKITSLDKNFLKLTKIYYYEERKPRYSDISLDLDSTKLIKLGGEMHHPQDEMFITRAHVIFTEKLQHDSNLVEAIKRMEKEQR